MSRIIDNHTINNVFVIDDDADFRSLLADTINEAHMHAISQANPVDNIDIFLSQVIISADAVVSDHHLRKRGMYFPEDGAAFISRCYQRKIPSVLVTRIEQPSLEIRKYRRNIPVVINPDDFSPDKLVDSLGICLNEFDNKFSSQRKAWRTLIRIDEFDQSNIYIIIPGWDSNEKIAVSKSELPQNLIEGLTPDMRLHAKVNIGAESPDELYFFDWETK